MNKKVFVSMLVLCIVFLTGLYIAKIFFPNEFVIAVQNQRLVEIGNFVDRYIVLSYLFSMTTTFFVYWLFFCACKGALYLNWKECLSIGIADVLVTFIGLLDMNIATHISISAFFIIPFIFRLDLRRATIIYSVHGLAQVLSLRIRDLPMYLTSINSLVAFILTVECYVWLTLFYLVFNYRNKNKEV